VILRHEVQEINIARLTSLLSYQKVIEGI